MKKKVMLTFNEAIGRKIKKIDISNLSYYNGLVKYDFIKRYIDFFDEQGRERYSIGLDQLTSTGKILDFIFQVNEKEGWCKPKHIKGFIECLEDLAHALLSTNAQGAFCPMGTIKKNINW